MVSGMESIRDEEPFLRSLMKGIAAQFGRQCEVVLHDLKDQPYDHTIVAMENGHVTGRRIGDCGTNLGLEVLRGTDSQGDKYDYFTQTHDGKLLRSSSIYIRDTNGEVVGALCINFDITDLVMAEKAVQTLTNREDAVETVKEVFTNDVNDLLDTLVQESMNQAGKPVALMTKEDKLVGLKYLDEKGAFLIKKAGDRISRFYDISKHTLYTYLDEVRSAAQASNFAN